MKNILIADDHFIVRAGTTMVIEKKYPNFHIEQAENYNQVLEKLVMFKFDLLLLDIDMPGTKYELMIQEIKSIDSFVKIIIFSVYEENVAVRYLLEGANGYLNKLSSRDKIIDTIDNVFERDFYYSQEIMKEMFLINQKKRDINPFENLTEKEKAIAYLLIEGNGNLEISNMLNIKMSTISTYKKKIFEKLNVKNVIELFNLHKLLINNNY